MKNTNKISINDSKKLAQRIRTDFFTPVNSSKITVFLCGASIKNENMIRYKIAEGLRNLWNSYYYDIIFPEDIFDELLYSSNSKDLLSLEGILAKSVDVIIIIPESPGSYAELGAFANDEKLRNKMICVIDIKHKKDKSFINKGPVKLIREANRDGVLYFDNDNSDKDIEKLVTFLKRIKKNSSKVNDEVNLLQLDNYLLPAIYLLEPISKDELIQIVGFATTDMKNAFQLATTALTAMTKKRHLELVNSQYKLTKLGENAFLDLRRKSGRNKSLHEAVALDEMRLEILNLKLRKKRLSN